MALQLAGVEGKISQHLWRALVSYLAHVLGLAPRIAAKGNAACFLVVANKNLDQFNRDIFMPRTGIGV